MLETVKKTNKIVIFSTLSSALILGVWNLFTPFLGPYLVGHGFNRTQISQISSLSPLLLIVIIPILGALSDTIGRKKVLNISLFLFASALLMYLFIDRSFLLLVFATMLSTLGFEAFLTTATIRAEDHVSEHRAKFTGYFETIKSVGSIIGSAAGTLLVSVLPINSTLKVALVAIVILLILGLFNPSRNRNKAELREFNFIDDLKRYLSIKELREVTLLGVSMAFHHPAIILFIPLFITQELHGDISFVGYFTMAMIIPHLVQFVFGYTCERIGAGKQIIQSVLFFSVAMSLLFFAQTPLTVVVTGLLMGLGSSAWNTAALCYLSEIGEKKKLGGLVLGSYASIVYMSVFAGFLAGGYLANIFGVRLLFVFYSLISIIAAFIALPRMKRSSAF